MERGGKGSLLKYFIAPGHRSSVNATARSSPSGKISKDMPTSSNSSLSTASSSPSLDGVLLLDRSIDFRLLFFRASRCARFCRSSAVAAADSSAETWRPMKPNQAKKLSPPIPVFSIFFFNAFCSGLNPPLDFTAPLPADFDEDLFASHALTTMSSNPPVRSRSFFHWMGTGSDTSPDQPSLLLRYQNFFSSTVSSKYSFSANSKRMDTDLGSPLLPSSESISKCETERFCKEERRRAESEGWMYWSMSGGACSRTRGQKFGIWEMVFERRE